MLDLETLSSDPDAAIISIGACQFQEDGPIKNTFQMNIQINEAIKYGSYSAETLLWWMQQSPEIIAMSLRDALPIRHTFERFSSWVTDLGESDCWSHATFDAPIFMWTYKKLGLKPPFSYKRLFDLRTHLRGVPQEIIAQGYTMADNQNKHCAVDDAVAQAIVWQHIYAYRNRQ